MGAETRSSLILPDLISLYALYPPLFNPHPTGLIDIGRVLPIPTPPPLLASAFPPVELFVDDQFSIPPFTTVTYTVQVAGAGTPLRATLCWYDPPNEAGFTGKVRLRG